LAIEIAKAIDEHHFARIFLSSHFGSRRGKCTHSVTTGPSKRGSTSRLKWPATGAKMSRPLKRVAHRFAARNAARRHERRTARGCVVQERPTAVVRDEEPTVADLDVQDRPLRTDAGIDDDDVQRPSQESRAAPRKKKAACRTSCGGISCVRSTRRTAGSMPKRTPFIAAT